MESPTASHAVPSRRLGVLMMVGGPSGSGKTTLCRRLCAAGEAVFSVSCTTRQPRAGEVPGKDYHYLTIEEFQSAIARGDFFEYAEVHGNYYGTLKGSVIQDLELGKDVLLDIDVQGASQVRACKDATIQLALTDIFILPPSVDELHARLTGRGTEEEAAFDLRMTNAISEMDHWPAYRYTLVSGSHDADYERFRAILVAERMRVSRYLPTR